MINASSFKKLYMERLKPAELLFTKSSQNVLLTFDNKYAIINNVKEINNMKHLKFTKIRTVVTLRCIWCGNLIPCIGTKPFKCPYCNHSI